MPIPMIDVIGIQNISVPPYEAVACRFTPVIVYLLNRIFFYMYVKYYNTISIVMQEIHLSFFFKIF